MFRLLGLHAGPDLSLHAAAAIIDLDLSVARRLLEGLAEKHLIELASSGRYRFHDLLRAYAAEQARCHDSARDRNQALHALLTWYTHAARVCDQLVFPVMRQLPLQIKAPARPMLITNRAQALNWLELERANLLAVLHQSVDLDLNHHALHLAESSRFLGLRRYLDEHIEAYRMGLEAAQNSGNQTAEIYFRTRLGEALLKLRNWKQAKVELNRALDLACSLNDRPRQAWALNALGLLCHNLECFDDEISYLEEALALGSVVCGGRLEAVLEGNLSQACVSLGRYKIALQHGERGLALRRRIGDVSGEAIALHHLARAWQGLGNDQEVITLCQDAIALGRTTGDLTEAVAEPLETLGVSLCNSGDVSDAIRCWQEAVDLFDAYGEPQRAHQLREHIHTVHAIAAEVE